MKKEYIAPVIITVVILGGLIFSWQWYQNSQKSTAAATPPAAPAAAKTS